MELEKKEIQQDLSWALGTEAIHQITKSKYRTQADKIKTDELMTLYNRHYIHQKQTTKTLEVTSSAQNITILYADFYICFNL